MSNEMLTQSQIKDTISSDIFAFSRPWLIPSIVIFIGTYAAIYIVKRFTKNKLPRDVKTAIPLLIGALYQIVSHGFDDAKMFFTLLGIGAIHGAIIAAFYDIALRRIKKKLHGEQ